MFGYYLVIHIHITVSLLTEVTVSPLLEIMQALKNKQYHLLTSIQAVRRYPIVPITTTTTTTTTTISAILKKNFATVLENSIRITFVDREVSHTYGYECCHVY